MNISADNKELRDIMKTVLEDILSEKKDLLYDILYEAIEDFALGRAMEDAEQSETVSRDEVFKVLNS